jgi:hypothetical protein
LEINFTRFQRIHRELGAKQRDGLSLLRRRITSKRWQENGNLGWEEEGKIFWISNQKYSNSHSHFRKEPPTDQELMKNLAIMQLKKKNAAALSSKNPVHQDHAALRKDETGQKASFPSYDEYEKVPGKAK